jgi:hypothetical protein
MKATLIGCPLPVLETMITMDQRRAMNYQSGWTYRSALLAIIEAGHNGHQTVKNWRMMAWMPNGYVIARP